MATFSGGKDDSSSFCHNFLKMTSTEMGYDMIEFIRNNFTYKDGFLYRAISRGGEKIGNKAGWITTCNGKLYWKISIKRKTMYLHQVIFLYHHGHLPKYIDHKDNNSTNNKIENLREATQSQNVGNSRLRKDSSSGYKGVTFRKDTKKWQSQIMIDGKHISLGSYETKEDAHIAYIKGSSKYFKEFANHG